MKNVVVFLSAFMLVLACHTQTKKMETELKAFIDSLEARVKPVESGAALAYFNAAVTGDPNEYERMSEMNIRLSRIYADTTLFAKLSSIRESGKVKDSLLSRQMMILYNTFIPNQVEEEKMEALIRAQTRLEQRYSSFRAVIGKRKYTDNELENILKSSANNRELEACWKASKQIGDSVAADVIELVRMRNEMARGLGYKNYHDMSLRLSDQDPDQIMSLFNELDSLTRKPFSHLKHEMDSVLALRYGMQPEQLMPWHYQNRFFQEAPAIYPVQLDEYYAKHDVVDLASQYFAGIGLDVSNILSQSDLYEKEGKYQHAFCTHIDRSGDVRIVCNVKNNSNWMNTVLHELGHGVYDLNIHMDLPFYLRTPAHTFTTEAIAMLFGRLSSNARWMEENLGIGAEEAEGISHDVSRNLRLEQLVFSRWSQVMFRFEQSMYDNPDQDLNQLWWDLVTKYQMIAKPADRNNADWASKIHIAAYPCYYHNYQLGELLASQLQSYINTKILGAGPNDLTGMSNNPAIGNYLLNEVFRPGARYAWNDMIRKATGEELTAKHYARQFVD